MQYQRKDGSDVARPSHLTEERHGQVDVISFCQPGSGAGDLKTKLPNLAGHAPAVCLLQFVEKINVYNVYTT